MKTILTALLLLTVSVSTSPAAAEEHPAPVRLVMIGLSHDHASGFLPRLDGRQDVVLTGIVETNPELIERYSRRFHLAPGLFYPSLDAAIAATHPQAAAIFTSTFEHEAVVKQCAKRGLDAMMEKPLAANLRQARAIQAAAKNSGIQLLVNYETTWYAGNQAAYQLVHDEHKIGDIRRMIVNDGHRGPKEIGCSTNFLNWLTDPVLNGGGAINDFGCYGADLATWLMDGRRPISVFATARRIKPDIYPKVEDEATIVLTYPAAQVILQPSWNWPFSRKDMEIYGSTGYVSVPSPNLVRMQTEKMRQEAEIIPPAIKGPEADPLSYLAAVVRREIKPSGLSSLEINMVVVEILDAAHRSVKSGRRVDF